MVALVDITRETHYGHACMYTVCAAKWKYSHYFTLIDNKNVLVNVSCVFLNQKSNLL